MYKNKYFKEIKKHQDDEINNDEQSKNTSAKSKTDKKTTDKKVDDFSKWTFNFNTIITLNKEFGINKNILNFYIIK